MPKCRIDCRSTTLEWDIANDVFAANHISPYRPEVGPRYIHRALRHFLSARTCHAKAAARGGGSAPAPEDSLADLVDWDKAEHSQPYFGIHSMFFPMAGADIQVARTRAGDLQLLLHATTPLSLASILNTGAMVPTSDDGTFHGFRPTQSERAML